MARTRSRLTPPEASSSARPALISTAWRISARAACCREDHLGAGGEGFLELGEVLHFHLDEHVGRGERAGLFSITALMLPAAMMWFSLIRMPSYRPIR